MYYTFLEQAPVSTTIHLLSGEDSKDFHGCEYLLLYLKEESYVFEIRYENHCSPFKEVMICGSTLAVGHEGHCYLFDLMEKRPLLTIALEGYFGHVYANSNSFFIADACQLLAITERGNILWKSEQLGIDGVVIKTFEDGKIFGEGEWDPPGGWVNFALDVQNGKLFEK